MTPPFGRVAILGTGLVGGSFGLALRRAFPGMRVSGWDRAEVLARARERGAIEEGSSDLAAVCREAELVYVALPVEETIRRLPEIAAAVSVRALTTDAASTKAAVCDAARHVFSPPRRFLGGHPIAGREQGGIERAEEDLFRGAPYVLTSEPGASELTGIEDERVRGLLDVVEAIGARPVWLDAAEHDHLFAFLSHLPQLAAIALAETVLEGAGEEAAPLAGPGLSDTLRLAGSPWELWAGICRTNPELEEALDRLIVALERVRSRLKTDALEEDFERAGRLYKILRRIE